MRVMVTVSWELNLDKKGNNLELVGNSSIEGSV